MTHFTAVIFDFGGVLVRTGDPVGRRAWETRLGLSPGDLERVVHGSQMWIDAQRGTTNVETYWARVAAQLGIAETDIPALRADYFRDDHLDLTLVELIKSLRPAYRVGLLSNDSTALEQKLRDELKIYDLFDAVCISAKIGVMKPDSRAYQAICEILGVQMVDSVFIDDNSANIAGAQGVGMKTIHYHTGLDLPAALQHILEGKS